MVLNQYNNRIETFDGERWEVVDLRDEFGNYRGSLRTDRMEAMDLADTPTAKATKRIMAHISEHLKDGPDHYNQVRDVIHRELLANVLVARLAK